MSELCILKVCTKCGEEKNISQFSIDRQHKSGLRPSCKLCMKKYASRYYEKNVDKTKKRHDNYRTNIKSDPILKSKYKEYHRDYNKKYRELPEHKNRRSEIKNKRKAENNPYKNNLKLKFPELYNLRQREAVKKYRKKYPEKIANYRTKRRNVELQAVPNWLNKEDLLNIRLIYLKRDLISEFTGIPHHVDHVYPLVNEYSCGLHVPWNLQILTESENLKKSNKLDVK